ncbi:Kinesin-like protein [Globisporangium polare]
MPSTADAPTTKEAIAQAIRRRNALQAPLSGSMNRTVACGDELDIARKLSFSAALLDPIDDPDESNKVQIVIRIRPLIAEKPVEAGSNSRRESAGDAECFRVVSETAMIAQPPKTSQAYRSTGTATSFQFSRIFPPATAQRELFVSTTKPVIKAAFEGKSGLVFAYGVTNSGKTYTISGTEEKPGMLPRALKYVIKELTRRKENEASPVAQVTASYLEIYNENVYDLLAAPIRKRRALRLQDCDGKIQVKGMLEKPIRSITDGEEILAIGMKNKQVAETSCNMDSSRSHCVFTLHFYHKTSKSGMVVRSKVSIVDLAGSERSAKTGATGLRMQEASKINGSLMNLMRCLETLRWNQQHPSALHKMVPFRESKLTRLFQENLVGKSLGPLVMIVAVNPSSYEFDETLRTLKYSAVARELVPVQSRSNVTQTRSQARKAGATFFYDLDGRLKKKQKLSIEPETPREQLRKQDPVLVYSTAGKSATSSFKSSSATKRARDDAQYPVNRSTGKAVKGVDPQSSRSTRPPLHASSVVKLAKVLSDEPEAAHIVAVSQAPAVEEPKSIEVEAMAEVGDENLTLESRLHEMEIENDELRRQLSAVNAEKLELEVRIRAEIGNQMHEQLQQIKAQYQEMAKRQQQRPTLFEDLPSARKAAEKFAADEKAALQLKVHQLQLQLNECEEEMERVRARHQQELDELRHPIKSEQQQ